MKISAYLGLILIALSAIPSGIAAQEDGAADFADLKAALEVAHISNFGEGTAALDFIRARVVAVQQDPVARDEVANVLAALLHDGETTYAFKIFACRQLYLIGNEEQADELIPLFGDPQLANLARYVLEGIPGDTINDALWGAVAAADGPTAAGLAASIAARGGAQAVARLSELLVHPHGDVVRAAIVGLGRIGNSDAVFALRNALPSLPEDLHTEYYEALLALPPRLAESGLDIEARMLYEELLKPPAPAPARLAAFHGLVRLRGEAASPMIAEALVSGEAHWVDAALACVRFNGGPRSTALFAQQLAAVPPETQAGLITALADRGDASVLAAISSAAASPDIAVQYAVIDALGVLGNETSVPLLLTALLSEDREAVRRARESLARMPDAGVNGALLKAVSQGGDAVQAAVFPIFADRLVYEALPVLRAAAATQDGEIRASAFKALGLLARETDLDDLAALLYNTDSEEARTEAASALTQALRRMVPSAKRTENAAELFTRAPSSLTASSVLGIYRALGDDALLPVVLDAADDNDSIVQDAAIAALAGWPGAAPIDEVYRIASAGASERHKRTALEGYIRMLRVSTGQTPEARLDEFKQAIALAAGDPELMRAILAGLPELKSTEALDIAEGLLGDPELHTEAAIAAERIRMHFYAFDASGNPESARRVTDGDIVTFWATEGAQTPGQWLEIDMFRPARLRGIVLDASRTEGGYPRGYGVYVFNKGAPHGDPVALGAGVEGVTEINFVAPVTGQIVRIEQTGSDAETPWVIHELRIVPE